MGDLGHVGAALVLLLLGPALVLVVRRRWRLAAARREEVKRLALLAAAEAERAEEEAALAYHAELVATAAAAAAGPPVAAPRSVCAVCFSPTSTRCSRCKAVKYCSGKCQIIHWRQGHKDECRPPLLDDKANDQPNVSDLTKAQAEQSGSSDNSFASPAHPIAEADEKPHTSTESSELKCSTTILDKTDKDEDTPSTEAAGSAKAADNPASEKPNLSHDEMKLGESVSYDTSSNLRPVVSLRSVVDSGDATLANGLLTNIGYTKNSEDEVATGKEETIASEPARSFRLIGTPSVHLSSNAHSENDFKCEGSAVGGRSTKHDARHAGLDAKSPSLNKVLVTTNSVPEISRKKDSSCLAASSEDLDEKQIETQSAGLNSSKTLRSPLAAASLHKRSSSHGGHSVENCTTKKLDNASGVLVRSSESGSTIPNGPTTSINRVLKQNTSTKFTRHYSSELMLFPYDLFIKLYNYEKIELHPFGLANCGNSCYANAVLQCLTFTRPLTAYLLEGLHSKACSKNEWCFTCEFESLVAKGKQGKSSLSPIGILSHLRDIGSSFALGREEDAHEFLRYIIDTMQSVCIKEVVLKPADRLAEETTLMQLIFGGYLRSKIKCMKCQGSSEQCERIMDLTVEIQGDIGSLEEALLRFTSTEVLDGENKYKCDRCKSYERAKKKLTILEAPNVLTIALKRFQPGRFGKINKSVCFPEYLNLARYMSGTDDKSPVYRLYALVVHREVMNSTFSGHYVCYLKDTQGKWYKINDSKVKPVTLEKVLTKSAYMLLYARCSPRAPSSLRKLMSHDQRAKKTRRNGASVQGGSSDAHRNGQLHPTNPRLFNPLDYQLRNHESPSDSSSLFSNSDESCSTESTRNSTSTEEYEHMFGDPDRISSDSPSRFLPGHPYWGSRYPSESLPDSPSSSIGSSASHPSSSGREWIPPGGGNGSPLFLYTDTSKQDSKLTEESSGGEANWDDNPNDMNGNVLFRRPTRERTARPLY